MAATCVLVLVERGQLDLDAPIARYWPEFAAAGKATIPVRWALCHKAGLADVEGPLTLEQVLAWEPVVAAIAAQRPNWEPGTQHGYHARSFGWITGELVRRVTGKTLGRFFADEIAAPLGLELWIGLPAREEPRVSTLIPAPPPADPNVRAFLEREMSSQETLLGRVIRVALGVISTARRAFRPACRAAFGYTIASASISTSAAASIRRATSTIVVAGRIAPNTSACAAPISCHCEMSVTNMRVRTTSSMRPPSASTAARMMASARRVCAPAVVANVPSASIPTVPETAIVLPARTARE